MILRLTTEEVELMSKALTAYAQSLSAKARPLCAGYSVEGMELCCRRIEAETLAGDLLNRQPRLFVVDQPAKGHAAAAHTAEVIPFPNRAA